MTDALTKRSFWDKTVGAQTYPSAWSRGDVELKNIFKQVLPGKRDGNILEMGCGNSYWLPWFAAVYGMKVYGIDYSVPRLDRAYGNLEEHGQEGTVICRDFTSPVSYWLGKMDVVYSAGVVEHFKDSSEILKLFTGYLKPDGVLITTVPHLKGFWGSLARKINKEAATGYKGMDLNELLSAHTGAGLQVVTSKYFRWGDPHVLNFSNWKIIPRSCAYFSVEFIDSLTGLTALCNARLPEALYSDMVVIARK